MRSFAGMRALAGWALFFLALGFAAVFALPAQASTTHATPAQKAYTAFVTWEHHPTRGNLDKLVVAGFTLPARYDQADIDQLAADVSGEGIRGRDVSDDEQYVFWDLTNGSGL